MYVGTCALLSKTERSLGQIDETIHRMLLIKCPVKSEQSLSVCLTEPQRFGPNYRKTCLDIVLSNPIDPLNDAWESSRCIALVAPSMYPMTSSMRSRS